MDVHLPSNGWRPRDYQQPLWDAWQKDDIKRITAIWHRRAGKDEVCLHGTCIKAHERIANYWHCLPEYAQARKAIWDAVNAHTGKRRIDEAFPPELILRRNDQEMKITFLNGSTWQVIGSDRYDSLVGAGVAGVTFSEWALANPSAWGYIRPMLAENDGWATFITTPRGRNHAKSMLDMGMNSPKWFAQVLPITSTGALDPDALEEARLEYITIYGPDLGQAQFEQEYLCSFNAAILGAFYARELLTVREEQRVVEFEALPDRPVHRAWDIGVRDDTAIWWFQVVAGQIRILDVYGAHSRGVDHYVEEIERRRDEYGWADGVDYVPHDARQRQFGTKGAKQIVEAMKEEGLNPSLVVSESLLNGINAARQTLARCVFHPRCEDVGLNALENYRREWDDDDKKFKPTPKHDWTSHYADAFRYMALSWRQAPITIESRAPKLLQGGVVLDTPADHRPRGGTEL